LHFSRTINPSRLRVFLLHFSRTIKSFASSRLPVAFFSIAQLDLAAPQ